MTVAVATVVVRREEVGEEVVEEGVVGGTRGVGGEATLEQCWLRLSWPLLLDDEQLWHDFLL